MCVLSIFCKAVMDWMLYTWIVKKRKNLLPKDFLWRLHSFFVFLLHGALWIYSRLG